MLHEPGSAAECAARRRAAAARRRGAQRRDQLDTAALAEEQEVAASAEHDDADALEGDCVANERRSEVSAQLFRVFLAADRALGQAFKVALVRALVVRVDVMMPGTVLGLDVFDQLAVDKGVREVLQGGEGPGEDAEQPVGIGGAGERYVRYVLACMMPDVPVAPGFFAGLDPVADLRSLVDIGLGRQDLRPLRRTTRRAPGPSGACAGTIQN